MQEVFEKIIEKLNSKKAYFQRFYECEGKSEHDADLNKSTQLAFDDAIEIVKQEAEKFGTDTNVGSNGWIPCGSGVMPRANGWYLVTNHLGVVQEQRWSANHWEKLRDDAVLAWRELPYPYQPKGE